MEVTLNDTILRETLKILWKGFKKDYNKELRRKHGFFNYCQRVLMVYAKDYNKLGREIRRFFDQNNISFMDNY